MEHPVNTFGARVRTLRLLAVDGEEDFAGAELDRLAGLHRGHVWQIEQGNRENPELSTVRGLAAVLGCTIGFLGAGERPAFATAPDVDPSVPEDREAASAIVRAAVREARAQAAETAPARQRVKRGSAAA